MKKVVIVGGGVVGLWCAIVLRQGGAHVTVCEAEPEHPTPYGPIASAAAAGMLAPLEGQASPHDALAWASFELWRRKREGAAWADGVRFDGAVVVSRDEHGAEALRINAERFGRAAKRTSARDVRRLLPFDIKLDHAVHVTDEGVADPLRVLSGLQMEARALGVLIDFHTDIANVTTHAALTHDGRVYEADAIVLVPGVWANAKLAAAAPALRHVRPAKGQLVQVEVARTLERTLRAPGFYLAPRREDVVLGATLEYDRYDRRAEPARSVELLSAAEALLPGVVKQGEKAWAGIRPMSPDGWPMIGPSGDGLLVAAGHSRAGWLLAPVTAEIISAYVFGADVPPEWSALSPQRFEA
ncbi:MAG: FAD-binding oxidoreductase [Hyphomonadaceae bacterium]|nr:FAD-binding oxidoreductase [Hyphomonadaceae bacterium]